MSKGIQVIREVIKGTHAINDETKYKVLGVGAACIHLIFTIFFGIYQIVPMFLYNMCVTAYYLYLGLIKVRSKQFTTIFISTLIEVLFHSAVASVLLGWNWGFMLYTIALVPVAFYLTYTLPKFKESLLFPIVWSIVVAACYFGVRLICENIKPLYEGSYPAILPSCFYYLNMMVTFLMLLGFSIFFALEIRYMQGRLEKENKTLGEIALFDPLTHLLNRRSMDDYLMKAFSKAIKDQTPFCLIMSDIDDFKKVNDTYGHDCGDRVLVTVANIMSACVRKNDYVCRWGGEEVLILLQANKEVATKVAKRICKEVEATEIPYKEKTVHITLTLGISAYSENETIHSMISEADRKLYHGKKNGKNQVVV